MFGFYSLNSEHLCPHTYTQSLQKNWACVKEKQNSTKNNLNSNDP